MRDHIRPSSKNAQNWSKSYICNLLEAKRMSSCHLTVFPMKVSSAPSLNQVWDYIQADLTIYQRLIRKLMYLACGTRPDIAFIVGQLSCHNSDPQAGHLCIAKQVLKYLKRTITLGIIWENDSAGHWQEKYRSMGVVGYANSNYTRNLEDKKSITGYCFFLRRAITT